jgi:hypothetical protein
MEQELAKAGGTIPNSSRVVAGVAAMIGVIAVISLGARESVVRRS